MRKAFAVGMGISMLVVPMTEPAPARVHGRPEEAVRWAISQPAKGLCGPASVGMVVGRLRGYEVGRSETRWAALELGLLDYRLPGGVTGMYRSGLVRLLDHFGIRASHQRSSMIGLRAGLDRGLGLILHVDAAELWHGHEGPEAGADHFTVLVGIDDVRGVAILNDPGLGPVYGFAHGTGAGFEVPVALLDDAWKDSGRRVVVAFPEAILAA